MVILIVALIAALANGLWAIVEPLLDSLYPLVFNFDIYIQSSVGSGLFSAINKTFYGIGLSLIVLKFLKKGFEIYVLWTDGDPDAEPLSLVVNFFKAIFVATFFPTIYSWFVDITSNLLDDLTGTIQTNTDAMWGMVSGIATLGIVSAIFVLVFLVIVLIIFFSLAMRGVELLILTAGVPLACTGLLDNDHGVWRAYVNQFVKILITTLVQILLLRISVQMYVSGGEVIFSIAIAIMAQKMPKLLGEFLVPSSGGGGGMAYKVNSTIQLGRMIKSLVK